MEFLNWGAEHPWLFIAILITIISSAVGIGQVGTTRTVKNHHVTKNSHNKHSIDGDDA